MTTMPAEGSRDTVQALWRGFLGRCPNCGKGAMFRAYLKVNDNCPVCHEELHHQRADDAPPYVTMLVVGHIVVALLLAAEAVMVDVPFWLEAALWSAVTVVLCLAPASTCERRLRRASMEPAHARLRRLTQPGSRRNPVDSGLRRLSSSLASSVRQHDG